MGVLIAKGLLDEWTEFYDDIGLSHVNLSDVKIPEHKHGFDRIIIVAKDLLELASCGPHNYILGAMSRHFNVWRKYVEMGEVRGARGSNSSYAVRFRDHVDADEELKNFSADELVKRGISGITYLERLLYELKYFRETGKHLDVETWTLCSGSRLCNNYVPTIAFKGGNVVVDKTYPSKVNNCVRARLAVI